MGVERFDRLRVVHRSVDTAAVWRSDDYRAGPTAVGAVSDPGNLGDDLVERGMDEVGKLDLCDRLGSGGGDADA